MLLAAVDSTGYKIFFVLHMLAIVVSFAPAVAHPLTLLRLRNAGGGTQPFAAAAAQNNRVIYMPALLAVGVFGFGLIGLSGGHSEGGYAFSDAWVGAAMALWLVIGGVAGAVIAPAERKYAGGDEAALARVTLGGQIVVSLFVVVVVLMVFKPGA